MEENITSVEKDSEKSKEELQKSIEEYSIKKLAESYEELLKTHLEKQKIVKELEHKITRSYKV